MEPTQVVADADASLTVAVRATQPSSTVDPNCRRLATTAIQLQREAICEHRAQLAARLGRAVTLDEAARDWIPNHAAEWRSAFTLMFDPPVPVEGICPGNAPAGNA